MSQSPKATLQCQIPQESGVSESPCVVPRLLMEGQGGFSVEVADRIKVPQRVLKVSVLFKVHHISKVVSGESGGLHQTLYPSSRGFF